MPKLIRLGAMAFLAYNHFLTVSGGVCHSKGERPSDEPDPPMFASPLGEDLTALVLQFAMYGLSARLAIANGSDLGLAHLYHDYRRGYETAPCGMEVVGAHESEYPSVNGWYYLRDGSAYNRFMHERDPNWKPPTNRRSTTYMYWFEKDDGCYICHHRQVWNRSEDEYWECYDANGNLCYDVQTREPPCNYRSLALPVDLQQQLCSARPPPTGPSTRWGTRCKWCSGTGLPANWSRHRIDTPENWTAEGKWIYRNAKTKTSQWKRPRDCLLCGGVGSIVAFRGSPTLWWSNAFCEFVLPLAELGTD